MLLAITTLQNNLGMSIELVLAIVFFLGELIFLARNFMIGLILGFMSWIMIFICYYNGGLTWLYPLVLAFMHVALMALSFIAIKQAKATSYY